MNLNQIQKEISAIELMAKYQPIIETILTTTDGGVLLSASERRNWIRNHALKLTSSRASFVLVEDFANGSKKLRDNALGMDRDPLGILLSDQYGVTETIMACTYHSVMEALVSDSNKSPVIIMVGNPPVFSSIRKFKDTHQGYTERSFTEQALSSTKVFGQDGLTIEQVPLDNCEYNYVKSGFSDNFENLNAFYSREDLSKILTKAKPIGKIKIRASVINGTIQAITFKGAKDTGFFDADEVISDTSPDAGGAVGYGLNREDSSIVERPIFMESDGETFVVPANALAFSMNSGFGYGEDNFEMRVIENNGDLIYDCSKIIVEETEVTFFDEEAQENRTVTGRTSRVEDYNCLIVRKFDDYPAIFMKYDELNPDAQPLTREQILEADIEVLTLPNSILARQMRVAYNGRKLPISAVSLDKWKRSGHTYAEAIQIASEHLDHYTEFDEEGVRINSGQIYEQTKNAAEEYFKGKNGKVSQSDSFILAQGLSKYAYTVEETFFNLNPNFSSPEKTLGYFLGMGILPNNLYINEISPYRLLCARILGIDYAINYSELCKQSAINGHLFVSHFDGEVPVFVNAEEYLEGNIFVRKIALSQNTFGTEMSNFFGDYTAQVIDHHVRLVEKHSPKFMRLRHDTQEAFEKNLRVNGFDKPYGSDRLEEVTRITLANGLFPREKKYAEVAQVILDQSGMPGMPSGTEIRQYFYAQEAEGEVADPRSAFQKYRFDKGENIERFASAKLRNNNLGKSESLQLFYEEPTGKTAGYWAIVTNGVTIGNDELSPKDDRETREISFNAKLELGTKEIPLKDEGPNPDQFLKSAFNEKWWNKNYKSPSIAEPLEELGYDLDNKKVVKALYRVVKDKVWALYHEISSQARIEGDNLYSAASALGLSKVEANALDLVFNIKYNNFAKKPISHIPIFLENMRHFGDLGNFTANMVKPDGKPAGFNLRQAQKEGLRFLGASGNSGLLAHEVGFGKTTSSIAKVSDLFLRGEAKRVLVCVPSPVYDGGNWEQEIQGAKNDDGSRRVNGLLPSYVTLVKIGSLNFKDLLGQKIHPAHPDWEEKAEGTEYNGPMAYSPSDLKLVKELRASTQELTNIVGGAFARFDKFSNDLTPKEVNKDFDATSERRLYTNPFFSSSQDAKKEQIVRLPIGPVQSLAGIVSFSVDEKNFWNIGTSTYLSYGSLQDIVDDSVEAEKSFLKKVALVLKEKAPEAEINDEDGGDMSLIFNKLEQIRSKYTNKYSDFSKLMYLGAPSPHNQGTFTKANNSAPDAETYRKPKSKADAVAFSIWGYLNDGVGSPYWPFPHTNSFLNRVVLPRIAKQNQKKAYKDIGEISVQLKKDYPWLKNDMSPEMESVAKMEYKTALELQFTEEISYFFSTLGKQAPLFLGRFKEWTKRPNTIVLCKHNAVANLSVPEEFGKKSIYFMGGIYQGEKAQLLAERRVGNVKKYPILMPIESSNLAGNEAVMSNEEKKKLFLSQYRGLPLQLLACQAFIVDEVHNFNRLFKRVKKGGQFERALHGGPRQGRRKKDSTLPYGGQSEMIALGRPNQPNIQFNYDTFANYSLQPTVQNFLAVCLYFQDVAKRIQPTERRKIENTIFLSATPFTDDNFQMLSVFGALNMNKLLQGHVFNTFDFFKLYAKELWAKDINYKNQYTLFAKIVGYKNIYSLSQMIKSFTDFKISDEEIEKNRPIKALIGTKKPERMPEDEALSKLRALVPYNEVQKKMNQDLENYITLKSNKEINFSEDDVNQALEIYTKLQRAAGKLSATDEAVLRLKELIEYTDKGDIFIPLDVLDDIVNLVDEILEENPDEPFAKKVEGVLYSTEEVDVDKDDDEKEKEEVEEDDDTKSVSGNVNTESGDMSAAKITAQRALQASRKQMLTLVSPYYNTINGDKKLMNPYLPPLDKSFSENSKALVENSPKLLYACQAIFKVLKYAVEGKGQTYADDGPNAIMGQVVFITNYRFTYHGQSYFIFDMMAQYMIDENTDFLLNLPNYDGGQEGLADLFASIDGRTRDDEKSEIVNRFNSGRCLVLFGTEIIREGINLQENCPIMYILSVGFVPMTFMQLHGRVWRQKNPYKYAFLINVLTTNSIDAFVYSKLEQKIDSVRAMLGSEVYDSEETQFDVDVKDIKVQLISDPAKLADMEWEDSQMEMTRQQYALDQTIKMLPVVERDYPRAIASYAATTKAVSVYSKVYIDVYAVYAGNIYLEAKHRKEVFADVQSKWRKEYDKQFPNPKTQSDFETQPEKFEDKKTGKNKYKSIEQVKAQIREKSSKAIAKLSLSDAIKAVKDANEAGELLLNNTALRFDEMNLPFELTENTPRNLFLSALDACQKLSTKAEIRFDKVKRDSYQAGRDLEGQLTMLKNAYDATKDSLSEQDQQKLLEAFGTYKGANSQRDALVLAEALAENISKPLMPGTFRDFNEVKRNYESGDLGIAIGLYNDLVGAETVGKRKATIEDIPKLIERKQKELDKIVDDLNNESRWKAEKAKEYADFLKKRDGKKSPSVESRVKQLDAILPYLEKRK